MRFKISLQPVSNHYRIPINYNHPLGSAVYRLLHESSPEYSEWLHSRGFINPRGKPLKLFCVSNFFPEQSKLKKNVLHCSGNAEFYVSSPFETKFPEHFANGILNAGSVRIANRFASADFEVKSVEQVQMPNFGNAESFRMLSPISVSTVRVAKGRERIHYFRPDEEPEATEQALEQNLLGKYETLHKKSYAGRLKIRLDSEYLADKKRRISKLIKVREGTQQEIGIKAFVCPLTIEGEPEIMKVAWDCGLGERNSALSLGMIEKIKLN